jgi:hypothetical protein
MRGISLAAVTVVAVFLIPAVVAHEGEHTQRVVGPGRTPAVGASQGCEETSRGLNCQATRAAGYDGVTAAFFNVLGHEGHPFTCEASGESPFTSIRVSFDTNGDRLSDVAYGGTTYLGPTAPVQATPRVSGTIPAEWTTTARSLTATVENGVDATVTCTF